MDEKEYLFHQQNKVGQKGEAILDNFLKSLGFTLRLATRREQRSGIDRIMMYPGGTGDDAVSFSLEYKTDEKAHKTGNAFLETISVERAGEAEILGWLWSCQADRILYYVVGWDAVYQCHPRVLRYYSEEWLEKYPLRRVKNKDYYTTGLLVPLKVIKEVAEVVYIIPASIFEGDSYEPRIIA